MNPQDPSLTAPKPDNKKPAIYLLAIFLVTIILAVTAYTISSQSPQARPKPSLQTIAPTQQPSSTQGQLSESGSGSQVYQNPFASPTSEYVNPFDETTAAVATNSDYQNPFNGSQ